MSEWITVNLGDCCEIVSGATPSTNIASYWNGNIYWATPKDLSQLNGAYISDTLRKLTQEGLDNCGATILPVDSVLFSSRAPIGYVAVNTVPMCTNQGFKSFVPEREQVYSKFLYHWLCKNRTYLESLGNGATFKEISKSTASGIKITLPPLEEQKRIAEILDRSQFLISKRQEAIALLDSLTQAIFIEMFGDPVSNPKGWNVKTCKNICSRITVGIVVQPASYYQEYGVPALRSQNIKPNSISTDNLVFFSESDNETKLAKTRVKAGDVVLVRTGQPGTAAVIPKELDGVNAIDLLITTPCKDVVDSLYLCSFLNSSWGKKLVLSSQVGQVQKHLNVGILNNAQIICPPLPLQKEFAQRVEAVEKLKATHRASLSELQALFASLQHRAFRGEL